MLRLATPEDALTIRAITRAAYAKWIPLIGREPAPMVADYDKAVSEHIIHIYEENNQPIALTELILHEPYLLIENICVLPKFQGKGIGQTMLEHVEVFAHTHQLNEIRLYTNAMFTENINYYSKHGYIEILREPFPKGGVVVHMQKHIN